MTSNRKPTAKHMRPKKDPDRKKFISWLKDADNNPPQFFRTEQLNTLHIPNGFQSMCGNVRLTNPDVPTSARTFEPIFIKNSRRAPHSHMCEECLILWNATCPVKEKRVKKERHSKAYYENLELEKKANKNR